MKNLFALIALLAFTVGIIGCAPSSDNKAPASTNAAPDMPAMPAAPSTNK